MKRDLTRNEQIGSGCLIAGGVLILAALLGIDWRLASAVSGLTLALIGHLALRTA